MQAIEAETQNPKSEAAVIAERWRMVGRVSLATIGCYVMAAVVAMALARTLPLVRSEATAAATTFGLLLWPCSVVAVFAYTRVTRIGAVMGAVTVLSALVAWLAGQPS